jgi:hypothetical protein
MKNLLFLLMGSPLLLLSCASHQKKIIVYASSDIQVDNTQKNINVGDGTTHHEKELDFSGSEPVQLSVQDPSAKFSVQADADGLYILNLKTDTVVGSIQRVGADNGGGRITRERLPLILDSLNKLVLGQNASSGRNFFIPPGKILRITGTTDAKIFGPFTKISGSFDAGSAPEIYKFYTNPEVREIIANFTKMNQSE